jgi:glycosyltransferase involved in cell wall biosynthesis
VRILFLAPRHPNPPDRGDQRRVLHLLEELSRRAEVTLVCFGTGLPIDGVEVVSVDRGLRGLVVANLGAPSPLVPVQTRLYLHRAMQRAVRAQLARSPPPDVVHVTLARMTPYLPGPGPWHRHLDLVDALSLNMATRSQGSHGPARAAFALEARLMRRYEARSVAAADTSSVVSEEDRLAAPGLASAAVIPNGVDLERFGFSAPGNRPAALVFFGNLGYFHNAEPARFVAEEVFPLVRAAVPEATLRIVGARPAAAITRLDALDGVHVVGPVEDMAVELHRCAAAVIPMLTGSGIKNKALEAMATGTPVVANRLGMQGVVGARPGLDYLKAEDAEGLAAACVELLRSPTRRDALAASGRRLVERRYTWAIQAQALLELYASRSS